MKILALVLTVVLAGCNLAIAQSPYATRLPAELQTAQMDSLADLTWLQGTTPAIRVEPLLRGRPVAVDADTTVRMVIGPSATGTLYAARTNLAAVTNAYEIQWPTIGTNSAGAAWFYTLLFDRAGFTYWSGSGALYIDASGYSGPDGVDWIEYTTPNVGWQNILGDNPATNAALKAYIESQLGSSEPLWIAASNSVWYRGQSVTNAVDAFARDWATAASNLAANAATGTPLYVETDLLYSAWVTNGPGATNAILADGSLVSIDGWGSGIPPDGLALASVAAFDAGTATIDLGSNWCWRLVADTDCTAINFSVASVPEGVIVPNTVKAILLEVSRGESAAWAWGGHLAHITNAAPAAGAVSHLLLIAPSQDVTATNGWTVF
jgi:hypothetical protein